MDKNRYVSPKKACEILGVHYKTLYNWVDNGKIEALRTPGGKRLYNVNDYIIKNTNKQIELPNRRNICYCRVSTYGQKDDLERQIEYMKDKFPKYELIKDIGSGLNFKRKGLKKIIDYAIKGEINQIIVVHKDRLCRYGFEMIEHIVETYSKGKITILEEENLSPIEEVTNDLVTIINVFSARINGMRKYKKNNSIEE